MKVGTPNLILVTSYRCKAAFVELVTETFAFQSALCCQSYANQHDDITAVMRLFSTHHLSEELYGQYVQTFMSELYRFIGFSVDYSAETKPEVYFKSGIHQTTLSLQLSLGFNGNFKHSTLSGKLAYAILQLRWASLTFAMGLKNNSANLTAEEQLSRTGEQNPDQKALSLKAWTEIMRSFFGLVSWSLSLFNFVVDELFTLSNLLEEHGSMDRTFLEGKGELLSPKRIAQSLTKPTNFRHSSRA